VIPCQVRLSHDVKDSTEELLWLIVRWRVSVLGQFCSFR